MRIVSSSPLSLSMRYAWTTSSTAPSAASIAIHDAILAEDYVGIIENQRSTLERDATALPLVDPVLFAVPLKSHRYTVLTLIPGKSTVPVGPTASESHFGYGCMLFLRARILNYPCRWSDLDETHEGPISVSVWPYIAQAAALSITPTDAPDDREIKGVNCSRTVASSSRPRRSFFMSAGDRDERRRRCRTF